MRKVASPFQVLVADDDPICRIPLVAQLQKNGYSVIAAQDGMEAWSILRQKSSPQLVILDWQMPGMEGVEVCRQTRSMVGVPYKFVILLTSRAERQDRLDGLAAGADEYLSKPFDIEELLVRLQAGERIVAAQAQLDVETACFDESHDPLLWNDATVSDLVKRHSELRLSPEGSIGAFWVHVDQLATLRDLYGRIGANEVLATVAKNIRSALKQRPLTGVCIGDELAIVTSVAGESEALEIAERIRTTVLNSPVHLGNNSHRLSLTIGLAAGQAATPEEFENILHSADAALCQAHKHGGHQIWVGSISRKPALAPELGSQPILIVEDDRISQKILVQELRKLGRKVLQADNARQAMELLNSNSVALLVTDLMMPEIDGLELIERVRQQETTSHLPVLIVSAVETEDAVRRAAELEVLGYVRKPVEPGRLRQLASDVLAASN